ncbi:hypothetical protein M407DRAFT_30144 [Tulasnella calospora MUT 4182]|uniref:Uncharacterized protein n=1 Tax=Tulasnella calospora MUT 4182 TaxID=1051891 RepID=A0A0C3PY90_9AGAM|nr:hypothetical protein M407DRAFT_30144 [Tulasnella calospora MUT 4182]
MSYCYQKEKNGQYKDRHEQEDVVKYRQEVFLPLVEKLERRMYLHECEGKIIQEPALTPGKVPLYEWKHDESTFYANDCHCTRWVHKSESPTPIHKGEGASIRVADFVSPEFGWCHSSDGNCSTRVLFKAGKNRDGYFTAEDVQAQTHLMLDIFEEQFPNSSTIAVLSFDNAPSHQHRSQDALSAHKMPKNTPKKPKNWFPSGEVKM